MNRNSPGTSRKTVLRRGKFRTLPRREKLSFAGPSQLSMVWSVRPGRDGLADGVVDIKDRATGCVENVALEAAVSYLAALIGKWARLEEPQLVRAAGPSRLRTAPPAAPHVRRGTNPPRTPLVWCTGSTFRNDQDPEQPEGQIDDPNSSRLPLTLTTTHSGAGKEALARLSRDKSQAMIQPVILELSVKISRQVALLEASSNDPAQSPDDLVALAWIQRSLEDVEATPSLDCRK